MYTHTHIYICSLLLIKLNTLVKLIILCDYVFNKKKYIVRQMNGHRIYLLEILKKILFYETHNYEY